MPALPRYRRAPPRGRLPFSGRLLCRTHRSTTVDATCDTACLTVLPIPLPAPEFSAGCVSVIPVPAAVANNICSAACRITTWGYYHHSLFYRSITSRYCSWDTIVLVTGSAGATCTILPPLPHQEDLGHTPTTCHWRFLCLEGLFFYLPGRIHFLGGQFPHHHFLWRRNFLILEFLHLGYVTPAACRRHLHDSSLFSCLGYLGGIPGLTPQFYHHCACYTWYI